jgi:hypothetical protein
MFLQGCKKSCIYSQYTYIIGDLQPWLQILIESTWNFSILVVIRLTFVTYTSLFRTYVCNWCCANGCKKIPENATFATRVSRIVSRVRSSDVIVLARTPEKERDLHNGTTSECAIDLMNGVVSQACLSAKHSLIVSVL